MQRKRPARLSREAAALIALALAVLPVGGAAAQTPCAPHERVTAGLEGRFAERPVAMALGDDGRLVELFTAPDGRTWTLLATTPEGLSCMLATGRHWIERGAGEGLVATLER